jgi:hypothetical protein
MLDLILLIANDRLEQDYLLLGGCIVDGLGHFECLIEISVFVMALGEVQFVLCDFWIEFGELFVDSGRVEEILTHVVAVGEEGHGSAPGAKLELVAEEVDGLNGISATSWYFAFSIS